MKIDFRVKQLTRLFSDSPVGLSLSAFLADPVLEPEKEQNTLNILRQLNQAASEKSTVVLQVLVNDETGEVVTLSGWVATKAVSHGKVMLQLQGENQQMRIVPIDQIQKISALSPKGELSNVSRIIVE